MRTFILLTALTATAAAMAAEPAAETAIVLRPARVFDGAIMHVGWRVLVKGERIIAAGTDVAAAGARKIDLPDATLVPGLIEGHSHLFLHPYNETSWDDQVLHESIALRTAREQSRPHVPRYWPDSRPHATSALKARVTPTSA